MWVHDGRERHVVLQGASMGSRSLRRLRNLAKNVAHSCSSATNNAEPPAKKEWSIAIHGGAGVMIQPGSQKEHEYHMALGQSLRAGAAVLDAGGSSEAAVEAAIEVMEDSPLFNCAHGSSVTMKGQVEMDAAMMSGNGMQTRAGAISSATCVRNPIKAARKVLEDSRFVLLTADGADDFAKESGLAMEGPEYFISDWRWDLHVQHMPEELAKQRQEQQQQRQSRLREESPVTAAKSAGVGALSVRPELKFGTVGCVALDRSGNLCAGTSTGGLNNKEYRRVGDSPIIGAGTYASNDTCAVSCTGAGENFIKEAVAHSVSGMMKWGGASLVEACDAVIYGEPATIGGVSGGLVAMDSNGEVAYPFNSKGMYRGRMDSSSGLDACLTLIWRENGDQHGELREQPIH